MRAVVMGIGNILLSDEGAGVHAVRLMHATYGHLPGLSFVDAGTLGFTLAAHLAGADSLIVFDAVRCHSAPGTVHRWTDREMDRYLARAHGSAHEIGLLDLLGSARLLGEAPARQALIGIEPESLEWGDALGPAVTAALPRAIELAAGQLRAWHPAAFADAAEVGGGSEAAA